MVTSTIGALLSSRDKPAPNTLQPLIKQINEICEGLSALSEMFVDLMSDPRKSVAQFFSNAQFGTPPPQWRAPLRLVHPGPTNVAALVGDKTVTRAARLQPLRRQRLVGAPDAVAGRFRRRRLQDGAERRHREILAAESLVGLPAPGPDPRTLTTNCGEAEEPKRRPVQVKKDLERNGPCWSGSGKKYEKCHGR